jgi:glycosyltransferase involved in cell wall biosynthesis
MPLLRALAELNTREPLAGVLEVLFVGPRVDRFERDAARLGLTGFVRFHDRVPNTEAAEVAAAADVLLVLDAPSDGPSVFLPSKLIDYLAFGKPILGVTPERGATARLLRRLECPVAPPDDVAAISAALADLVRRHRDGTLAVADSFDRVAAEFDIAQTTGLLHDVLTRAFGMLRASPVRAPATP